MRSWAVIDNHGDFRSVKSHSKGLSSSLSASGVRYFVLLTFILHEVKPTGFGIKIASFLLYHVFPEFLSPSTDAAGGEVLINVCNEYKSEA